MIFSSLRFPPCVTLFLTWGCFLLCYYCPGSPARFYTWLYWWQIWFLPCLVSFQYLSCLIWMPVWPVCGLLSLPSTQTWAGTQRKEISTPLLLILYIWCVISNKRSCLYQFSDWILVSVEILSVPVVTICWLLSSIHCNANMIPVISTVYTKRWSEVLFLMVWNENCCSYSSCFGVFWSICKNDLGIVDGFCTQDHGDSLSGRHATILCTLKLWALYSFLQTDCLP